MCYLYLHRTTRTVLKMCLLYLNTDTVEDFEQWTKLGALKGVDGVWKLNEKFVCPSSARVELMSLYNGLAHAGPEKLHSMISKTWWWPKMKNS